MTISKKTSKILWTLSGNQCAFCGIELIERKDKNNVNLIIGEECHIISSKTTGPRHILNYGDYDQYDNIILLCRNDHRLIDAKVQSYTIEDLKRRKEIHENKIKISRDNAKQKNNEPIIRVYLRIRTGKELLNIIKSAQTSFTDHDETKTKKENEEIANFCQNIKDLIDLFGSGAFDKDEEIKLGFRLNKDVKKIEALGFYLFGGIDKFVVNAVKKEDMTVYENATLIVIRQDNSKIINAEKIMVITTLRN